MATQKDSLVVVDIGNSEIIVGLYRGQNLVHDWRLVSRHRTPDEVELLLDSLFVRHKISLHGIPSVLCSVVPAATSRFADALFRLTGMDPIVVGEQKIPGLAIRFSEPASIGPDRLANAIAVQELYGKPAIVVDLGTATTFDVIGPRGEYLGGAIAPGLWTSSEELFRRAARLARVELELPSRAIGKTTAESLQSGILLGAAGMVDTLVRRIAAEIGEPPHVVATGGMAAVLAPACETVEIVDEQLTLHGLWLIHRLIKEKEIAGRGPKSVRKRVATSARPGRKASKRK
jgi:type III pantothenate kinase